jgi:isoleucyl-tRNA synthetase
MQMSVRRIHAADIFDSFKVGDFPRELRKRVDLHKNIVDEIVLVSKSGQAMKRRNLIDVWFS